MVVIMLCTILLPCFPADEEAPVIYILLVKRRWDVKGISNIDQ